MWVTKERFSKPFLFGIRGGLVEKKVEHKKQSFTREKEEKGEKEEKQKKKKTCLRNENRTKAKTGVVSLLCCGFCGEGFLFVHCMVTWFVVECAMSLEDREARCLPGKMTRCRTDTWHGTCWNVEDVLLCATTACLQHSSCSTDISQLGLFDDERKQKNASNERCDHMVQ